VLAFLFFEFGKEADVPNWLPCEHPMNRKEGRDL